jgi:phage terminase small subunit
LPRLVRKDKHLAAGLPSKPANLPDEVSRQWDRLAGEIEAAHIQLTPAHRSVLELAARIAADLIECAARLLKDGEYIETKAGLVSHPASKRKDALRRDYIKVASMLGLRSAVAGPPPDKGKSLEDILDE